MAFLTLLCHISEVSEITSRYVSWAGDLCNTPILFKHHSGRCVKSTRSWLDRKRWYSNHVPTISEITSHDGITVGDLHPLSVYNYTPLQLPLQLQLPLHYTTLPLHYHYTTTTTTHHVRFGQHSPEVFQLTYLHLLYLLMSTYVKMEHL